MQATKLIIAIAACLLASCASRPAKKQPEYGYAADGAVRTLSIVPADAVSYPEIPGASYMDVERAPENALPVYPPHLLAKHLPATTVIAKTIVNVDGSVDSVEIVQTENVDPEFQHAVIDAVRRWRFIPLRRVIDGKEERLPTTEHFLFEFSQVNGKAVVKPGK